MMALKLSPPSSVKYAARIHDKFLEYSLKHVFALGKAKYLGDGVKVYKNAEYNIQEGLEGMSLDTVTSSSTKHLH